ncbi:hypothetical protein [Algoriphagus jejuensis]
MKTQLIIYPAMIGMLMLSCAENDKSAYTESVKEEVANAGTMEDPKPLGQHELIDTLQLSEPLRIILNKDSATAVHKIRNVRKYTEDGTEYYEITFDNPVEEMQVITYDELGKIKSPDL